ncbi:MipA/OmpV family protein [Pseudoalteromonas luteoviolacea]|uniref:MipA/OmpV family protein n=1 Tax=Pseudoalteromonas luteoviolacea TaxID=43657 RepID=UPI001B361650|nr:MipA/OmpV family protein [Pseudoalteromonas luteoviolacea]MBQ4835247.1 MipA/OmpV family protein [Pseudoalteromonas luteoviolacea]
MKLSKYLLALTMSVSYQVQSKEDSELKIGLGGAFVTQDEGYKDVGSETQFVPAIAIEYGDFRLLGPFASYTFYRNESFELSAIGMMRLDGYEQDDNDLFKGMEDRDMSFDLGLEAEFDTEFGEFAIKYTQDASSTHKGYEATLTYGAPFRFKKGQIKPYIAANFASKDLTDYYYGVKQSEATAQRSFYEVDSATNLEVGISSDWFFGQNHMIKADVSYMSFDTTIKDSPLVDKSGTFQLLLGYVYVF